jgi:DNA processing protein
MEPTLSSRRHEPAAPAAPGAAPTPVDGVEAATPDGAADLRRRCLWLAERAAYDRGLIGRLVKAHGSFAAALGQPSSTLSKALRSSSRDARRADTNAGSPGEIPEGVVTWCDPQYPPRLRELFDPPPALFLRGRLWSDMLRGLRERPTVAVVGARHPSPYGLEMAWLLGAGLARAGVNVVSGMALGIDAQAHAGALEGLDVRSSGEGLPEGPVALAGVLGAGVRMVVPRTNEELFGAIARRGVLLSEYGWSLPPFPWRFPARNRLIAALSDAVVIVEGRATSGALHTAAFALDLGRDVLAVPGEAGRPLSAGPHRLLRDGAHLCESPGDVLALLPAGPWSGPEAATSKAVSAASAGDAGERHEATLWPPSTAAAGGLGDARSASERRVLAALRRGQHSADQLARALELPPQAVSAALTALEIDGLLDVQPGGRYRLRRRLSSGAKSTRAPS